MKNLYINEKITISAKLLKAEAVRSSGPGGQNVNKVSTKVILTFNLAACKDLPHGVKDRLRRLVGGRTARSGMIFISSQQYRSRERNLKECRTHLAGLVRKALKPPLRRKKTHRPPWAEEQRLQDKRRHSRKKLLRRKSPYIE